MHSPWKSPVQNPGVGSHSLLQGIFLNQELNRDLLHWHILYHLSHQGTNPLNHVGAQQIALPLEEVRGLFSGIMSSCSSYHGTWLIRGAQKWCKSSNHPSPQLRVRAGISLLRPVNKQRLLTPLCHHGQRRQSRTRPAIHPHHSQEWGPVPPSPEAAGVLTERWLRICVLPLTWHIAGRFKSRLGHLLAV